MPSVLITGCSSGFGYLSALSLARRGWRVFASMRTPSKGSALLEEAAREGLKVGVLALDVTSEASVNAACAEVLKQGPLDAVVNNAGYGLGGVFEDSTVPEIEAQLQTNYFGALRVMKAVLPSMRVAGRGTIVNVSSIATAVPTPGLGAYAASKAALETHSFVIGSELAPFGVKVCVVCPGAFKTSIFDTSPRVKGYGDPASPYTIAARRVEQRVMARAAKAADPQAVADAIADLCEAKDPPFRTFVGFDAQQLAWVKRLAPDGLVLKAIGWALGRLLKP